MFLRANEGDDSPPSDQDNVQHLLNLDCEPSSIFLSKVRMSTFIFDTGTRASAALDRTDGSNLRNCSEDRLIAMSTSSLCNNVCKNGSAPEQHPQGINKTDKMPPIPPHLPATCANRNSSVSQTSS